MPDASPPPPPPPLGAPMPGAAGPLPARAGFWVRVLRPIAAVLLAFALAIPFAGVLLATPLSDDSVNALFAFTGSLLIAVFGFLVLRALPAHERRLATAVTGPRARAIGIGLAVGVGVIVASVAILLIGAAIDPGIRDTLEEQTTEIGPAPWQIAVMVIALVVLAPIGEELVFRGLLLRGLVRRMPFGVAAVISGVLFAGAHVDAYVLWPRAIALVVTGIVLAMLYRRRGYPAAVAAHAVVNAVAAAALIAS